MNKPLDEIIDNAFTATDMWVGDQVVTRTHWLREYTRRLLDALGAQRPVARMLKYIQTSTAFARPDNLHLIPPLHKPIARSYEELPAGMYPETWEKTCELYAAPRLPVNAPLAAIGKLLTWQMDIAVANGADSRSMPDEYVAIAAWLCGIPDDEKVTPDVWSGFHTAWTKCVGTPHYDKAAWLSVQMQMREVFGETCQTAPTSPQTDDALRHSTL